MPRRHAVPPLEVLLAQGCRLPVQRSFHRGPANAGVRAPRTQVFWKLPSELGGKVARDGGTRSCLASSPSSHCSGSSPPDAFPLASARVPECPSPTSCFAVALMFLCAGNLITVLTCSGLIKHTLRFSVPHGFRCSLLLCLFPLLISARVPQLHKRGGPSPTSCFALARIYFKCAGHHVFNVLGAKHTLRFPILHVVVSFPPKHIPSATNKTTNVLITFVDLSL